MRLVGWLVESFTSHPHINDYIDGGLQRTIILPVTHPSTYRNLRDLTAVNEPPSNSIGRCYKGSSKTSVRFAALKSYHSQ